MRHVSQEHWFKLGRLMTPVGPHRALVSWSASMFEYFMPLLVMRSYPRTLLSETYHAVISRHIEYAKAAGTPWGISESAYNVQDAGANYQYRAFGVPGIGLKRGLADDLVVAPYACLLAAPLRPKEVIANLEHLASEGALGPMGYYEAIDYTKERLEPGQRRAIVRTYMAHHQGMSLVALNNCLNDNIMQARFHADPRVQAAELLLQERSPHLVPLDRPPEEHQGRGDAGPRRAVARAQVRHAAHRHAARASALERIVERDADERRRRLHALARHGGHALARRLHVRRVGHVLLRARSHGGRRRRREPHSGRSGFSRAAATPTATRRHSRPTAPIIRRRDGGIETFTEVAVSPEDDAEIRRISITNHSRSIREIELTSYAEVVLAPHAADLAHPAFSNLFIESSSVPDYDAIICARRPRAHEKAPVYGPCAGRPAARGRRRRVRNRSRALHRPRCEHPQARRAHADTAPLSGATGAVLDPIVSLRARLRVPPGVTARVSFTTVVAENEDGVRALDREVPRSAGVRARVCAGQHA